MLQQQEVLGAEGLTFPVLQLEALETPLLQVHPKEAAGAMEYLQIHSSVAVVVAVRRQPGVTLLQALRLVRQVVPEQHLQ
jgi:hypothetical protein